MKKLLAISITFMAAGAISLFAATGKENWTKHCAKCHGEDGKGQTAMGKKLKVKDYTDAKVQAELKDDAMAKATKEGVKDSAGKTLMKGYGDVLSDQEVKDVVAHIRTFKK